MKIDCFSKKKSLKNKKQIIIGLLILDVVYRSIDLVFCISFCGKMKKNGGENCLLVVVGTLNIFLWYIFVYVDV